MTIELVNDQGKIRLTKPAAGRIDLTSGPSWFVAHANRHENGGSDEITVENLSTGLASGRMLKGGGGNALATSSLIDGITGSTVTLNSATLGAPRTINMPDRSIDLGSLVNGYASLANANRMLSTASTGTAKESAIEDSISGNVLEISGTLTAKRTLTMPNRDLDLGGVVLGYSSLSNANRMLSTASTGTAKESAIADGISGGVLSISGTLTSNRTVTFPDSNITIVADPVGGSGDLTNANRVVVSDGDGTINESAASITTTTLSGITKIQSGSAADIELAYNTTTFLTGSSSTVTIASGYGLVVTNGASDFSATVAGTNIYPVDVILNNGWTGSSGTNIGSSVRIFHTLKSTMTSASLSDQALRFTFKKESGAVNPSATAFHSIVNVDADFNESESAAVYGYYFKPDIATGKTVSTLYGLYMPAAGGSGTITTHRSILTASGAGVAEFVDGITNCGAIAISGSNTVSGGLNIQSRTYAEIHLHDGSNPQSIATGSTYVKWTDWGDNGLSNDCTADAANDKITITRTGHYRVEGSFSFSCGTNNVVWFGSVFLNGVEQDNVHFNRKVSTSGDVGNAGFTGFIDVTSAPVDLDFRLRHDNGSTVTFTGVYANMNVERVGDT